MLKVLVSFLLICSLTSANAQVANTAAGASYTGKGGSVSYTVGQSVYTSFSGSGGSVNGGVQQTYTISIVSGLEEAQGISLGYSIYPNPTNGVITLKIENYNVGELSYQLYDVTGRLLRDAPVDGPETIISVENELTTTFFLRLSKEKKAITTFKIVKN
jgi:hypothetical protein